MIARLRVLLPFTFSIWATSELPYSESVRDEVTIRIHPPLPAINISDSTPLTDIPRLLAQDFPPRISNEIVVNEASTYPANVLQIDFIRHREYDRRLSTAPTADQLNEGDPSIVSVFDVVNDFLSRIQSQLGASAVRNISPSEVTWRIDYLNDDTSQLIPAEGFVRGRVGVVSKFSTIALTESGWNAVSNLSSSVAIHTWDTLLLDAEYVLPEVGPSIVLAYSAIETCITVGLDAIVKSSPTSYELWKWLNVREHSGRDPSVTEMLSELLDMFAKRSLKRESQLWQSFCVLRNARNSFVHKGRAVNGTKPVAYAQAVELLQQAREIIDWLELLLPVELHRKKWREVITFTFNKPFS